jgi:Lrp/AsnC family leucine-responsive transcriptional regulator
VIDSAKYKLIMDRIDQKIIRELQLNARLTNQELAEKINLSPSPCLRRVRKLEESGLLGGYTALVDQEQYGLPINVFVSVRLEVQNNTCIKEFEAGINTLDEVMECYLMAGNRDYLMRVVSIDLKSYEHFIREKLAKIPGISSIESSFAFGSVKCRHVFPSTPVLA